MVRQSYPPGCPIGGKFFDKKGVIMAQEAHQAGVELLSLGRSLRRPALARRPAAGSEHAR
jgi:hypothetical protein